MEKDKHTQTDTFLGILVFPALRKQAGLSGGFWLQAVVPQLKCCSCAEAVSQPVQSSVGTAGGRSKPSGVRQTLPLTLESGCMSRPVQN